ncbi:PIG-L deacetylase family protein [Thermincola ferriacetica]
MGAKKHIKWFIAITTIILGLGAYFNRFIIADWFTPLQKTNKQPVSMGERILIIAPHPDDETLGGAGVIEQALRKGKKIKIIVMTCGDGYKVAVEKNFGVSEPKPADFRKLGRIRHLESLKATGVLGVKQEDVIFFGYPDGGINGLWEYNWDYTNLHKGFNGFRHSPYSFSYEKGAPYCGANVVKNLTSIINEFKPTDILYPDPYDQHHDHWATNAFVKYVLAKNNFRTQEWTYLVHRGDYPWPWEYAPNKQLHPPYVLKNLDTRWHYLALTSKEQHLKSEAVKKYVTQTKVMDPFLEAFIRKNDLIGSYPQHYLPFIKGGVDNGNIDKLFETYFSEPSADTILTELEGGGDIVRLSAAQGNNGFYVGLQTRKPLRKDIRYNLRIRLFRRNNDVKRMDLSIYDFRITALRLAKNSLALPTKTSVKVKGNRLIVSLPLDFLDGVDQVFFSGDTILKHKRIDKAAWRVITVKKK